MTLILLMIGVALTIGITLGGRFADRRGMVAMIAMLGVLAASLFALPLVIDAKVPTLVLVFVWAMASFGLVPGLQSRVVDKARDAPNLASTLNIAGFNLGNAGGAFLGGVVIEQGWGLSAVPVAAGIVAIAGYRRRDAWSRARPLKFHTAPASDRAERFVLGVVGPAA